MNPPNATYLWWATLCLVSLVNMAMWYHSARWLARTPPSSARESALRRTQLLLSLVYVLGCAYRSALPVFDVPRLALFDSQLSSALIGRSVATVAELAFAVQWALMLHATGRDLDRSALRAISWHIVPLVVCAELCSWYAVLTTSNLGHVLEESLWAVCALLLLGCLLWAWPRTARTQRRVLAFWCTLVGLYAAYLVFVDVPMYWMRWVADEAAGRGYLGIGDGVLDAWSRWKATDQWAYWRTEVVWMSLYFSVGAWMSIGLVRMPALRRTTEPGRASEGRSLGRRVRQGQA